MVTTRITLRLPVEMKKGLDRQSKRTKKPVAEILRMLVQRYLNRCKP